MKTSANLSWIIFGLVLICLLPHRLARGEEAWSRAEVAEGVELAYRVVGEEGPWVVIPMGRLVDDLSRLADSHRVLLYDTRGRGASTAWHEGMELGIARETADLEALRAHLGIERASVLGVSFYGAFAAVYAAEHPAAVERVVMVGPMAPTAGRFGERRSAAEPIENDATRRFAELTETGAAETDPVAYCHAYQDAMAAELYHDPAAVELHRSLCELPNERPDGLGAWAGALFSGLGDWDFRDAAREVAAPALVIQGRQDRITPPAGAEDWTALLPNAELLWVAEAGHVPLQERPEVVWPAVERFLAAGR